MELKYLNGYPEKLLMQVKKLLEEDKLGEIILKKYPKGHELKKDKDLYKMTMELKNNYIKRSKPLDKVCYDKSINLTHQALGLHIYKPIVHGKKTKMKNEIRICSSFKRMPYEFLEHIVVHELAHLKEKDHNKAFYKLCENIQPSFHQVEFDLRLYITYLDKYKKSLY